MKAIDRVCENCVKRKTIYCPDSKICYDNISLPYFQDRIMLLKENETLMKKLKEIEEEYIDFEEEENSIKIELRDDRDNYYERLQDKYKEQKEFIKYLEKESKEVYRDGGLRQNIYKEILQKYEKIIGVLDEKEN